MGSSWSLGKTEKRMRREKCLDHARELKRKKKQNMEHECDGETICKVDMP